MTSATATSDNQPRKTPLAPAIFIIVMCVLFSIGAIFFKHMDPYGRYQGESRPAALQELQDKAGQ